MMNRFQSVSLNVLGLLAGLAMLINLGLVWWNGRLSEELGQAQTQINRAQNVEGMLNNVVAQTRQLAESDAALRQLLVRHRFLLPEPGAVPGVRSSVPRR